MDKDNSRIVEENVRMRYGSLYQANMALHWGHNRLNEILHKDAEIRVAELDELAEGLDMSVEALLPYFLTRRR